jgi:hypothetical protein
VRLRPDILKLDMSLTRDIDVDPAKRSLAAAMVHFARETRALIVAEGIETEAEHATLRGLGVHRGQGYLLGRPGDAGGGRGDVRGGGGRAAEGRGVRSGLAPRAHRSDPAGRARRRGPAGRSLRRDGPHLMMRLLVQERVSCGPRSLWTIGCTTAQPS